MERAVAGKTAINITLKEDAQVLDEVVVTALGIKRSEKALSYNVQQVNADAVTTNKDPNFINSLSGKVAGEPKIKTYFTTLGKDLAEAQAQKDALAAAIEPILK